MTKAGGPTCWAGGDHVADLDLAVGDDDAGHQPLDQLDTSKNASPVPFHWPVRDGVAATTGGNDTGLPVCQQVGGVGMRAGPVPARYGGAARPLSQT